MKVDIEKILTEAATIANLPQESITGWHFNRLGNIYQIVKKRSDGLFYKTLALFSSPYAAIIGLFTYGHFEDPGLLSGPIAPTTGVALMATVVSLIGLKWAYFYTSLKPKMEAADKNLASVLGYGFATSSKYERQLKNINSQT